MSTSLIPPAADAAPTHRQLRELLGTSVLDQLALYGCADLIPEDEQPFEHESFAGAFLRALLVPSITLEHYHLATQAMYSAARGRMSDGTIRSLLANTYGYKSGSTLVYVISQNAKQEAFNNVYPRARTLVASPVEVVTAGTTAGTTVHVKTRRRFRLEDQ